MDKNEKLTYTLGLSKINCDSIFTLSKHDLTVFVRKKI